MKVGGQTVKIIDILNNMLNVLSACSAAAAIGPSGVAENDDPEGLKSVIPAPCAFIPSLFFFFCWLPDQLSCPSSSASASSKNGWS